MYGVLTRNRTPLTTASVLATTALATADLTTTAASQTPPSPARAVTSAFYKIDSSEL